jgi:dihydrofolate reductase
MRKVTAGLFHSIDGVVEAPFRWQGDSFDDDLGQILNEVMGRVDTVLLGRVGYEEWAAYWPKTKADGDFAEFINAVPKHVATRTLKGPLAWSNSHVIEGDVEAFVRDLKARDGGEIAVMGGISLVRQLFLAGLLDELSLITHPVIAGENQRHLFQAGDPTTQLKLVKNQVTAKGNVVSTYAVRA